ncbi:AraC family transcriptional regulator [Maridesulfovibrio sp.]|uniref:AraC family transcriptional regulator n=1 Tax=Maridesulfovibrio sp. TaxID=2795000 RepID=UPI0029F50D67|nr:AraC family transcriptional regulator [Maridesulfovibrio sp.]
MKPIKPKLIFHEPDGLPDVALVEATGIDNQFPRHVHSSYIFTLIDNGERKLSVNSTTVTIKTGELCILPPGIPHRCEPISTPESELYSYRALCVTSNHMVRLTNEIYGRYCREPDFDPEIAYTDYDKTSFEDFFTLIHVPGTEFARQAALNSFLYHIIEKHSRGERLPRKVGAQLVALQRVKSFIDQNFQRQITLPELAETACLSPFHLQKIFVDEYGRSPQEYVIFKRIKEAQRLIESNTPLIEAALKSGFSDQSHFSKHFKKVVGISPGRFSKENI